MRVEAQEFSAEAIAELDQAPKRYLERVLSEGARLGGGAHIAMTGKIKVGAWLRFSAHERLDPEGFEWEAQAGLGSFRPIRVSDGLANGKGHTRGQLFGRMSVFDEANEDVTRSAAGRLALEAVAWAPWTLLRPEVEWMGSGDDAFAVTWSIGSERPVVHGELDEAGALRRIWAWRWGKPGRGGYRYEVCRANLSGHRSFGLCTLPARGEVGWGPGRSYFFRTEISEAEWIP